MFALTDHDYDVAKYQEDDMNARGLRYRPVSPAVRAMAERLSQETAFAFEPTLSGLDQAVLAARRQA